MIDIELSPAKSGPLYGRNCVVKINGQEVSGISGISFTMNVGEFAEIKITAYPGHVKINGVEPIWVDALTVGQCEL